MELQSQLCNLIVKDLPYVQLDSLDILGWVQIRNTLH